MNLSITLRNRRTYKEYAGLFMIKSGAWIMVALFLSSLGYIAYRGAGTLSPSFLSTFPEKMMEEGGHPALHHRHCDSVHRCHGRCAAPGNRLRCLAQ